MTALAHEGAALAAWHYRRLLWRRALLVFTLALLLLLSVLGDLASGASGMGLGQLLHGVFDPATLSATERVIIWNVRLPYSLMAVLVGAALALAGAEMQAILDNPLASPFTLGVSSSAALGASLAIAYPLGIAWLAPSAQVTVMAFIFACLSVVLLQAMSRLRGAGVESLVLFGIALVFSCNALVSLLQLLATEDVLQQLVFWTLGSLARADWHKLGMLALVLGLLLPFSLRAAPAMTLLRWARTVRAVLASIPGACVLPRCCASACCRQRRWHSSAPSVLSAWSGRTSPGCWSVRTNASCCPPVRWWGR